MPPFPIEDTSRMKIKTLVPAFGSNRLNARRPSELLQGCEWIGVPFAGGMSEVAYFAARTVVINDTHHHVINLARCIASERLGLLLEGRLRTKVFHPDELVNAQEISSRFDCIPKSDFWDGDLPNLDAAVGYFVSVWMSRSGLALTDSEFRGKLAIRWNASGGDSVVRYRSAIDALVDWRKILSRATFSVLDCFEFLGKCKDQSKHGIYCDPPWPSDGNAYKYKFSEAMQRQLAETLARFDKTRVVVRFGDHPLIRELYPKPRWTWNLLTGRTQANEEKAEVLLTNWKP